MSASHFAHVDEWLSGEILLSRISESKWGAFAF